MQKKFNSLDEINRELRILDVQRLLHYQKIFQSVDVLKEELTPSNIVRSSLGSVSSYVSGSKNIKAYLATTVISFILSKFFKK